MQILTNSEENRNSKQQKIKAQTLRNCVISLWTNRTTSISVSIHFQWVAVFCSSNIMVYAKFSFVRIFSSVFVCFISYVTYLSSFVILIKWSQLMNIFSVCFQFLLLSYLCFAYGLNGLYLLFCFCLFTVWSISSKIIFYENLWVLCNSVLFYFLFQRSYNSSNRDCWTCLSFVF